MQRFLKRCVLNRNGNGVVPDVLVEHQRKSADLRHTLQDFLNASVFEFQRHRLPRTFVSCEPLLDFSKPGDALQRLLVCWIELRSPRKTTHRLLDSSKLSQPFSLAVLRPGFFHTSGLHETRLVIGAGRADGQSSLELFKGKIDLLLLQKRPSPLGIRRRSALASQPILTL